jgi:hypothetical protein
LSATSVTPGPDIPIRIIEGKGGTLTADREVLTDKIRKVAATPDHNAIRAHVIYNQQGIPEKLVLLRFHKNGHTFDFMAVHLDANLEFRAIESDYRPSHSDQDATSDYATAQCPDTSVQFISISPYDDTENPNAVFERSIAMAAAQSAREAGLKTVELYREDATAQNWLNYMSCPNVVGNFYDGDSNSTGIVAHASWLSYEDFQTFLTRAFRYRAINYWIACNADDEPFRRAMEVTTQSQQLAAGVTELGVGSSDYIGLCAMQLAITSGKMTSATTQWLKAAPGTILLSDGTTMPGPSTGYLTTDASGLASVGDGGLGTQYSISLGGDGSPPVAGSMPISLKACWQAYNNNNPTSASQWDVWGYSGFASNYFAAKPGTLGPAQSYYGVCPPSQTINPYTNACQSGPIVPDPLSDQFDLISVNSGQCLDLPSSSQNNGVVLQQWTCYGGTNQRWIYSPDAHTITSAASHKCMDVQGHSNTNGALVQQYDCSGQLNQQWDLYEVPGKFGTYTVVSAQSGKCLDVKGASKNAGTQLQQWDCNGGANQQWRVGAILSDTHALQSQLSSLCLDVPGGSTTPGTNIDQATCGTSSNEKWLFNADLTGSGIYMIQSTSSWQCLDVRNGSTQVGADVDQTWCTNSSSQQWLVSFNPEQPAAPYALASKGSGLCLQIRGSATTPGTVMQQSTCDSDAAELWRWWTP